MPHDDTGIVAKLLFQLEDQIDAAYVTSALLNAALVDARRDRRLSAVVGQQIFRKAAATTGGLSEVRGEAVEMHRLLEALGKRLGVPTDSYGPVGDKPNDFTVVGPSVG